MSEVGNWIEAHDRKPVYHRKYFVKVNGRKECWHWYEIEEAIPKYEEILWLEEPADVYIPSKPKQDYEFKKSADLVNMPVIPKKEKVVCNPPIIIPEVVQPKIALQPAAKPATIKVVKEFKQNHKTTPKPKAKREQPIAPEKEAKRRYKHKEKGDIFSFENMENPIAAGDILYFEKMKTRAIVYDKLHLGVSPTKIHHYGLPSVKKLFPNILGGPYIPAHMIQEIKFIYGLPGFNIIRRKVYAHYSYEKYRDKRKKQPPAA